MTATEYAAEAQLLLVEVWRPRPDWPHGWFVRVFDGSTITPEELEQIELDPNEHDRYLAREWDSWTTEASPRRARQLEALLRVRKTGKSEYLVYDAP
ncbi:hypothetical protein ABZ752_32765 [Streptomyces roseifaciens]